MNIVEHSQTSGLLVVDVVVPEVNILVLVVVVAVVVVVVVRLVVIVVLVVVDVLMVVVGHIGQYQVVVVDVRRHGLSALDPYH